MNTKLQSFLSATVLAFAILAPSEDVLACAVSDMKFNGDPADACIDRTGNADLDEIKALPAPFADNDVDWSLLLKGEQGILNPTGTFMGFDFSLTGVVYTATSGIFTLAVTDKNGVGTAPDLPAIFDFVGVLKASNAYSAYLFENAEFLASNNGIWTVSLTTGNNGSTPNLSNFSLYIRGAEGGFPPVGPPLPEPGILFLMGAGLLGLGMARRRKSA